MNLHRILYPMLTASMLLALTGWTPLALAYTDEGRLPFVGAIGELPTELALRFVRPRLGQEGQIHYATLTITQQSQPEGFDAANITIIREGLMDDSVKGVRQRLRLSREGARWTIREVDEDFSCYRGHQDWGRQPCQ